MTHICDICGTTCPPGRRLYCCDECLVEANRRKSAARSVVRYRAEEELSARRRRKRGLQAMRRCLRCGATFLSKSAANRICGDCTPTQGTV